MTHPADVKRAAADDEAACLWPSGRRFAFTIVHDADAAYSARLRPLFEVFDELGLRLTVSAFALWADWARDGAIWSEWRQACAFTAPVAVPLCDPDERRFYQDLAARGHEIALHTPSDTSSTTAEIAQAFELFKDAFGHYPRVYTEHSAASNKDALGNQGADPGSAYYSREVLLRHAPWVWVDGPGGLGASFRIAAGESPLDHEAQRRYGLPKAFARTGRWRAGDGDGFLACYTEANLDALEHTGGTALVYTHLDAGWLDPKTRRMRTDLEARLRYLAAKPGWFAPAGEILDRIAARARP